MTPIEALEAVENDLTKWSEVSTVEVSRVCKGYRAALAEIERLSETFTDRLAKAEAVVFERGYESGREDGFNDGFKECLSMNGDPRAEADRLAGLLKDLERGWDNHCPWCSRWVEGKDRHRDDCPAFTPDGEGKRTSKTGTQAPEKQGGE